MPSPLNNKLLNVFTILVKDSVMRGAVTNLKTGAISMERAVPVQSMSPSSLASDMEHYLSDNGIGGINTYIAIPPGSMTRSDMRTLSRVLRMKKRESKVMRVEDILAYRTWNAIGGGMEDDGSKTSGRTWATGSRFVLVMIDGPHATLSMVDSGRIVGRLAFPEDMYSQPGADAGMADMAIYVSMLNYMHSWVDTVFSPDRIIYYITGSAPDMQRFRDTHDTIRNDDIMGDVADGARVIDVSASGVPEFISSKQADYKDFSIRLEDDNGVEHDYPIFQH